MVYTVTLEANELRSVREKLRLEQRLTKAARKDLSLDGQNPGPPLVLLLSEDGKQPGSHRRRLAWLGVVAQHNTVGAVDRSITIDPLRECMPEIEIDGPDGLLDTLDPNLRELFNNATQVGEVGLFGERVWNAFSQQLRTQHPSVSNLLDWLLAQASPPRLDSNRPEDRSWQEQRDATLNALRIADFPDSAATAWNRPNPGDPYLAGLVPEPVETDLMNWDINVSRAALRMREQFAGRTPCHIHVLQDTDHRRLEIVNVNARKVEGRLGTDLIYYHEPTHSFVLVQYKRLNPTTRSIHVDDRFMSQLDRLERVAQLSGAPTKPSEWRLGTDPCFFKLAYWPEAPAVPSNRMAPGMYLPTTYIRLLLRDSCTASKTPGSDARHLSYGNVERHLINTQFTELVKHGLAGTVNTTVEQLQELLNQRVADGHSVVLAKESSLESAKDRQKRLRTRSAKRRSYAHKIIS